MQLRTNCNHALIWFLSALTLFASGAISCAVVELGPGGVHATNVSGQVVGIGYLNGGAHAFLPKQLDSAGSAQRAL